MVSESDAVPQVRVGTRFSTELRSRTRVVDVRDDDRFREDEVSRGEDEVMADQVSRDCVGELVSRNEIVLRGRVSAGAQERELPSGARVVVLRLVVAREPTVMTRGSRQRSDWVECAAWSGEQRRKIARWAEGDVVEVSGALRRRHYRSASGASSVVEVEVLGGRRISKAATGASPGP